MRVSVRSPERTVYETDDASYVLLPGRSGDLGVMPDHTPLLTPLKVGVIAVRREAGEQLVTAAGGFAEITQDGVRVLADAAELAEDIDRDRVLASTKRAQERLREAEDKAAAKVDVGRARLALLRAVNRLAALEGLSQSPDAH